VLDRIVADGAELERVPQSAMDMADLEGLRQPQGLDVPPLPALPKSRRPGKAALEKRIREICETRVRYGYRRVQVVLEREGWPVNIKNTYRIYRE